MESLEGLKFDVRWENLKKVSDSQKILEDMVDCFTWIRERDITQEEMIELIERDPLQAEVVVYGIHGLMLQMKLGNFYWNVFPLKDCNALLSRHMNNEAIT